MPNIYITKDERHVLSYIAGGQFDAQDRQLYHDHVTPRLIRELTSEHGQEGAVALLDGVIARIDIRRARAKDRRCRYELACYRSWLANAKGQIEGAMHRRSAQPAAPTFMEAVKRIIARQAQP